MVIEWGKAAGIAYNIISLFLNDEISSGKNKIKNKVIEKIKLRKKKWAYRKTHIYRKCPNCKAEIRLPKKKGKHVCTCPRCKKDFDVIV